MDLWDRAIKEEYTGGSSCNYSSGMTSTASPQPMEGLHDPGPPPFLTKTYDIIEDSSTNHIISWSRGNNSFVVWDPQAFSISLLPRYFKHNNFSSFVRQLNTYGFRKVDPDRWEFANEGFLRGQKHLLKTIRRRRAPQTQTSQQTLEACVEVGTFRLDEEVDRLSRDKQVLMVELVKLKQQQQTSKACLQLMEQRIKRNENKQQHMMSFLARAMQNPTFVKQLVQQKDMMKELEEEISKKRRRSSYQGRRGNVEVGESGHGTEGVTTFVKIEPREFGDFSEFEVPEFLNLAMNMQELSESQVINLDEECIEKGEEYENKGKNFDEAFWEGLLNEDIDEQIAILGGEGEGEEDVNVLVEQLGYLGYSPK